MEQNNMQQMPMNQNNNSMGLSVASMVLGICSLVFMCFIPYLPIITSIVGIVLAALALKNKQAGKGMAIAGLVLSIIALVIYIVCIIIVLVVGTATLGSLAAYY